MAIKDLTSPTSRFCKLCLLHLVDVSSSKMDINTLSPEQQELFYRYGIGLDIPVPFALIHQAFESFVDCQPDSIAIEYDGSCMTYKQLEESANSLANRLISNDLLPRQRVCLVVQRSFELVIAILAVLKCGCQYVPLDGGVVPDESLAHILRDTAPTVVLCLQKFVTKIAKVADGRVPSIVLDDPALAVMEKCISRPQVSVDSSDGAYLIYTSGKWNNHRIPEYTDVIQVQQDFQVRLVSTSICY